MAEFEVSPLLLIKFGFVAKFHPVEAVWFYGRVESYYESYKALQMLQYIFKI